MELALSNGHDRRGPSVHAIVVVVVVVVVIVIVIVSYWEHQVLSPLYWEALLVLKGRFIPPEALVRGLNTMRMQCCFGCYGPTYGDVCWQGLTI